VILNRDLYSSAALRNDECYLVTRRPRREGGQVVVEVDLDAPAAVLERHRVRYPRQPYSERDIRNHRVPEAWLLSGGALVMDEVGRIALGLRDGNAAAPFTYTNVAAGRCDGPLLDHCLEEIASECLLFVRVAGGEWRQVDMGPATPSVAALDLPAVAGWLREVGPADAQRVSLRSCTPRRVAGGVDFLPLVFELSADGRRVEREVLEGYVFINPDENTTEFRIARAFDLSPYAQEDRMLIFGEGTGHALWKTPDQIRALCRLQREWGTPLVTPFMERLVGA